MIKGLKLKLYPSKSQEIYINKLLGSTRFVYNKCLEYKKEIYIKNKVNVNLSEMSKYLYNNLTKDAQYIFLTEHNTKIYNQELLKLMDAYKRFFINGNGFPKFKSKRDKQSCRFPKLAISIKNNYNTKKLTLTKQLKNLKFGCSIEYLNILKENKDDILSATLTKTKSNNYYLSILINCDYKKQLPKPINNIIGIDLGIKTFITTSNNEIFNNLKLKRNNQKKLNKLHRELSRKINNSKNKEKQRIKLAKFYEKLNNKKENYLHEVTNKLLNDNQVIVMEDLNVSGMMKNHKLARSIQELSLHRFKSILEYKANWYGRDIIIIDRYYPSSKLCSNCNYKIINLKLSERDWICLKCKSKHDRDHNAAINILNEGERILNNKIG